MQKICVIGLGYVGLPICLKISKKYETIGFDTNKIHKLINQFIRSKIKMKKIKEFGYGNSNKKFIKIISKKIFWKTSNQKYFKDFNK